LNDMFGHTAGDELLKRAAHCLRHEASHAYRLGGDEFAIVSSSSTSERFEEISYSIEQHLREQGISFAIGSVWQDYPSDIMTLYHRADEVMYANKRALKVSLH